MRQAFYSFTKGSRSSGPPIGFHASRKHQVLTQKEDKCKMLSSYICKKECAAWQPDNCLQRSGSS
jgi:hypothetical protein